MAKIPISIVEKRKRKRRDRRERKEEREENEGGLFGGFENAA